MTTATVPAAVRAAQDRINAEKQPAPAKRPVPPAVAAAQARLRTTSAPPAQQQRDTVTQPATPTEAEPETLLMRSGRRGVQEIASAPGAIGGLYGLAGAGIDMVVNGKSFGDATMSDEGRQLIAEANAGDVEAQRILKEHPETVLRTGLQSAAEWRDWGGKIAHVTNNPDGSVPLDEEIGGIALSTALTLPASIFSKPAAAINRLTSGATKFALTSALRAAELATPVTILDTGASVTRKGAIMGANLGIATAMNDVTRVMAGDPTLTAALLHGEDEGSVTGPVSPVTGLPSEGTDTGAGLGATAAGVGGVAALGLALRPGGAARLVSKMTPGAVKDAARAPADLVRGIVNRGTDDVAVLVDDVRKAAGSSAAENFDTIATARVRHSTDASHQRYTTLGILGGDGKVRVAPEQALRGAYDKLTPAQRDALELGLRAEHEQAERNAQRPQMLTNASNNDLQMRVNAMTNDPQVNAVREAYHETMMGQAETDFRAGMISHAEMTRRTTRKFVPSVEQSAVESGIRGKLAKVSLWASKVRGADASLPPTDKSVPVPQASAMDALQHYMRTNIAKQNETIVKRAYLNAIANAPDSAFPNGVRSVTRIVDKAHSARVRGHAITVPDFGREITYKVADPRTVRQLQFRPHAVSPTNDFLRRTFQKFTTGPITQPLFAFTALTWDATFGMLAADNNRIVTGELDRQLKKYGAPVGMRQALAGVTRPIDTALIMAEGLYHGAHGRFKQAAAEKLARNVQLLGGTTTPAAAQEAADAFLKTRYGLMHMSGYPANSFAENYAKLNMIERAANKIWWIDAVDTIRDAYRMGLFARNVAAAKMMLPNGVTVLPKHTYDEITRHVRKVASDPTRRGTSDWFNKGLSFIPYGGVAIHSIAHLFAQWKNPAAFSTVATITAAALYSEASMSPEAQTYVTNNEPDYARIANMYFELPHGDEPFDPDKHLLRIPLGPELGGSIAVAKALFKGAFGEDVSSVDTPMGQQVYGALASLFNFATPVGLNIAVAASGKPPLDITGGLSGRSLYRTPRDDQGIAEQRGLGLDAGVVSDRVYNMLVAVLGATGRTWGEMAEIADSQVEKYDSDFYMAADNMAGVLMEDYVQRPAARYNLFAQGKLEKPLGTHASNRAYEIDGALDHIATVMRALHPSIDGPMDADIKFSKTVTEMPQHLKNPILRQQGAMVAHYFTTPFHAQPMDEIGKLRTSFYRMKGNYNVPPAVRIAELNRANNAMQERYDIVLADYGEFEQAMREKFADPHWTLNRFANSVDDALHNRGE